MTHVLKEGWGYYDITNHPYGGNFHRATSAIGVTLTNKKGKYPDEVVIQAVNRTLVVKRGALVKL